jgi:hypothetical protein
LTPSEVREAQLVFAQALPYGRIWVYESARWPDWLGRVGATLSGSPPPAGGNSVTLGFSAYFPTVLHTKDTDLEARVFGDMAWLIHELTHAWQYQHSGPGYLLRALQVQLRLGPRAYDYGRQEGLQAATVAHRSLNDFNPEQQGDIARDYYIRLKLGLDKEAWEPFVAELRGV